MMRDPDECYAVPLDWGRTQRRTEIGVARGRVTWFLVQLEFSPGPREDTSIWKEVARFDHRPYRERGHDITDEGIHMDIYKLQADGHTKKVDQLRGFPPKPVDEVPDFAEKYLEAKHDTLIAQFLGEKELGLS